MVHKVLVVLVLAACDPSPRAGADAGPDVSVRPAPPVEARPEEGCLRTGSIEGVENDPSCVLRRSGEESMRTFMGGEVHSVMKRLSVSCALTQTEVISGLSTGVKVTITNTSAETTIVAFEARPRPAGARPDWSRVSGIPEMHPPAASVPKLFFQTSTTDGRDRDVDALPVVAGSAAVVQTTTLGVHLKPGGKLVYTGSWWAMSIPAPNPIYYDDAGHRYVPKTAALHLPPGEYNVVVDVPFWGLDREERKVTARVRVVRTSDLDGGALRPY